jgi:hypothetical protein
MMDSLALNGNTFFVLHMMVVQRVLLIVLA